MKCSTVSAIFAAACLLGGSNAAGSAGNSKIVALDEGLVGSISAFCKWNSAPPPKLAEYVEGFAVDNCPTTLKSCEQVLFGGYEFVEFSVGTVDAEEESVFLRSIPNNSELPKGYYRLKIAKRPNKRCDAFDALTKRDPESLFNPLRDDECVEIQTIPRLSAKYATRSSFERENVGDMSAVIRRDQVLRLSSGEIIAENKSISISSRGAWSISCSARGGKLTTDVIPPKILEPIK